jgi:hypothetical protein
MATAPPPVSKSNPFDRVPPANLDAERSVLGSLLLLNDSIDEVAEFLTAQHFYSDRHQAIFAAIHELYESGVRGIDVVTLSEQLEKKTEARRSRRTDVPARSSAVRAPRREREVLRHDRPRKSRAACADFRLHRGASRMLRRRTADR